MFSHIRIHWNFLSEFINLYVYVGVVQIPWLDNPAVFVHGESVLSKYMKIYNALLYQ